MIEIQVMNEDLSYSQPIRVSSKVFGLDYNESLVHQLVVAYQLNARLGTRAQKNRRLVSHSTKKPWRQKGTGRARAGMVSSPLWRGGGRAFPNMPNENFSQKINRKMYRKGISIILSQLLRENRVIVVEDIVIDTPKTKVLAQKIKRMDLASSLLVITDMVTHNLCLSSRNLVNLRVLEAQRINPYLLLQFKQILLTKKAVMQLEELLV